MDSGELAERRRRLLLSGAMAVMLATSLGLGSVAAGKLGISAVTPPKSFYSVTLQALEPVPPPPAPPARPAASAATDEAQREDAAPDEVVPEEPDEAPTEVMKIDLEARPRARVAVPGTAKGQGGPLGGGTGIPGVGGSRCLLPPCLGTQQVVRDHVPRPEPATSQPVQAPIKTVMARSVFTPNPDQTKLSRTPTGLGHRSPGKTTISFCIDGDGKTYDVRVRRGFRGDREVDEICRQTVARWRFSPQRVGGKARSTCSTVTFDIRFD